MASKINRQLPSDINAEAAVLSAMMIDNYIVARAVEMFDDENFYRPAHKKIFQAMRELFNNNTVLLISTIIGFAVVFFGKIRDIFKLEYDEPQKLDHRLR